MPSSSAATTTEGGGFSTPSLIRRLWSTASLLPLRSPRRTLADFHIKLDDPHRVYSPTDLVSGYVCLTVERPLSVTHLTVSLVGCVNVCTPAREPGKRKRGTDEWGKQPEGRRNGSVCAGFGNFNICWDEIVLCGEGRLEPGVYQFGFELEFCKLPGIASLPTSLDFEKGSISYSIVATLTRPVANPTTSCFTKISLMDTIDIARYPVPKPRVIKLGSVSRHHHHHRSSKRVAAPRSVSPSTIGSTPNSSTGNLHEALTEKPGPIHKSIVATVELMNSGALRGENVGVKITIQHTKKMKSVHGIILTLMRQTRFDPTGNVSLEKLKVGGITTLPSTFRKDLSQTICPIIIDPVNLTAVVRANLRVPEDVFPTITNVPGGAVEFRYWVEVIMDLGGKLNGDDLFSVVVPGFPGPTGDLRDGISKASSGMTGGNTALSMEGGAMIETERVRQREKSVVSCKFEVIVGTVDSVGRKGRMRPPLPPATAPRRLSIVPRNAPPPLHPPEAPEYDPRWQRQQEPLVRERWQPPPVDEKTRVRIAEEQLLPSAPVAAGPSSAVPSAPPIEALSPADVADDDKVELERLRLIAEESLPPGMEMGESSSSAAGAVSSAPALELDALPPEYHR